MLGGGFNTGMDSTINSPSHFMSPSVQSKPGRRLQNLIATTCKTITDSTSDPIMIAGTEVNMLTVVGIIKSIDTQSTKITYTIEDSTGSIQAVKWIENEGSESGSNLMEMTYCKVFGSVRTQQGTKNLIVYKIVPITDLNQLTTHLLEVIHDPLKIRSLKTGAEPMDTSVRESDADTGMSAGLGGPERLVYQVVQMSKSESGANKAEIINALRGKLPEKQIENILGYLSSEGHIYTTVDDETFKSTDS